MPLPEPQITRYQRFLRDTQQLEFHTYDALWRWSVTDLEAFWRSIWQFFDLQSPTPYERVLGNKHMPGARWFEGAQVNYAQQVLRHADAVHAGGQPAMLFADEAMLAQGRVDALSWADLRRQVATCAVALQRLGVARGDRVCAFLPNRPETAVVFLACASLGAIWSICSPDMGPVAVLDRFRQIEPKVLIACDGYRYGGARTTVAPWCASWSNSCRACGIWCCSRCWATAPMSAHRCLHAARCMRCRNGCTATRRSSPSGCRSTIRCGWCIRAAPPACRSRSCTATAA